MFLSPTKYNLHLYLIYLFYNTYNIKELFKGWYFKILYGGILLVEKHKKIIKENLNKIIKTHKINNTISKTTCINHSKLKHFMYLNEKEGTFSCPVCNFNNLDIVQLCAKIQDVSEEIIIIEKILRLKLGINTEEIKKEIEKKEIKKRRFFEINKEAARFFNEQLYLDKNLTALKYLNDRKILPETIKKYCIGYAPMYNYLYKYLKKHFDFSDEELEEVGIIGINKKTNSPYDVFKDRIIFPIMDENNNIIGFGGRALSENPRKYINTKSTLIFQKSNILYGINNISKKSKNILICEGFTDVISLHQKGIDWAVGTLGTAFTEKHYKKIKKFTNDPIIMFDGDEAGKLTMEKILKKHCLKTVILPKDFDPDKYINTFGKESFINYINSHVQTWEEYWISKFGKENSENIFKFLLNIKND